MEPCSVCGSTEFHQERVSEILQIDGSPVLVENIPAMVCVRCGEPTFSRVTTENVRRLVHGDAKPIRALKIDVFDYV